MTQVNGMVSVDKTNLYRAGVNQPALAAGADTGQSYCANLIDIAPPRLALNKVVLQAAPSPAGNSLYDFLIERLRASYDILGCATLLNLPNPI